MLYIVPTPIGNLKDITLRAIETLQSCDYILCEDTRHSLILLKHYHIEKQLVSFHKFSEATKEDAIIFDLRNKKNVGLISDAGTPGIADPGNRLIKRCIEEGIEVVALPGACAIITALSASGLDTQHFQFCGFLPKQTSLLNKTLQSILQFSSTTVCYESPERIQKVLNKIQELDPQRQLVIGRELTKKFEEFLRGTAAELLLQYSEKKFKGEIVLLISGSTNPLIEDWVELTIEEHVAKKQKENHLMLAEAIKKVAEERNIPKREVYNKIHQGKKN